MSWTQGPTRHKIYDRLVNEQGGEFCAICGEGPGARKLSIDHDHACCGKGRFCEECVRGLLCNRCNIGIGAFLDDPDRLASARVYVMGGRPLDYRGRSWVA